MNSTGSITTAAHLESLQWKPRDLPGHIGQIGPMWTRKEPEGWAYGLLCESKHLNPAGVMHGGVTTSLLDHAISAVAWETAGRLPCLTVQLDTHFLAPVAEGQFAEVRVKVNSRSRSLMFLYGEMVVNGTLSATTQAVMKIMAAART
ncbi:PaaI family thioesterase [Diaphorobacter sp. HDW4A]|uniref:PaaI family thioesterase n=1 Tax=Diaphorobacter sp. HDW4A TaxID=2714924 RepID=UPI00197EC05D|nr:PaaI family thioesterase [Diaphorobacter sp. HDW4A]